MQREIPTDPISAKAARVRAAEERVIAAAEVLHDDEAPHAYPRKSIGTLDEAVEALRTARSS